MTLSVPFSQLKKLFEKNGIIIIEKSTNIVQIIVNNNNFILNAVSEGEVYNIPAELKHNWDAVFNNGEYIYDSDGGQYGPIYQNGIITYGYFIGQIVVNSRKNLRLSSEADDIFLTRVTHELRSPLSSIIGAAKLLEMSSNFADPNKQYIQSIINASEHLLVLIDDIIDIAQLDSTETTPETVSPVDITEIIEKSCQISLAQLEQKKIRILKQYTEKKLFVSCDQHKLTQIFINILSNSIKYTSPLLSAGSSIIIKCDVHNKKYIKVSIIDHGVGMEPEQAAQLPKLFTRFNPEMASGTGLGLVITKKLIDILGAKIYIKSRKNVGTRVTMLFPSK